jgi:hypothetical protein
MEFFDANCFIGTPAAGLLRPAPTAGSLLEQMDRSGIGRALVWHVAQRDCGAGTGNRLLTEAIAPHPDRLTGVWSVLPQQTGEMPEPEELCRRMAEAGVRALRAWPQQHRFLLRRESMGDLLEAMVEKHIPLMLSVPGTLSWEACYDLLADFPRLVCILADMRSWGTDRYFRPLVRSYPNCYVSIDTYYLDGGIEAFVQDYGPDRMLFGTGFPGHEHGAMMLALRHAEVPEEARRAIAGGNLRRLLEEVDL